MNSKWFYALIMVLLQFSATAQISYDWWNNIHQWDGITPWTSYIPNTPGKMGPNALPVPDNQIGRIDTQLTLLVAQEWHQAPGDFTTNAFLRANVPIKKAVALQVWWVPVAYFATDTMVRDMRAARTRSARGLATGDVYISTLVPIVTDKAHWPDILLNINLKTASGTRLQDARFADAPGYFFELSAGKDFNWPSVWGNAKLRWYASAGFLAYQTSRLDYYQNDAIMAGGGIDVSSKRFTLRCQLNGYAGYLKDLDTPVVGRVEMQYHPKNTKWFVRLQNGNASYPFFSLRAGAVLALR